MRPWLSLKRCASSLRSPKSSPRLGAKIPKGVLLYGPPGTGKTLLAKAVAGEAGVPFYSISGSDFVEMFVGVGASRVRDLFKEAKSNPAAIVFVDEIDAVGRRRGVGMGGGNDEREQTLNQLLVEMDGFDGNSSVIVIAATNRPDVLDPALLRPGRFDRQIGVDAPDMKGRQRILEVHAAGKPIDRRVDLGQVAKRTPGFTGADLANVMNEAALLTARDNGNVIDDRAIDEAIDRVMAGPQRTSRIMSEHERKVTAYHEGGHALVAAALRNSAPVTKIRFCRVAVHWVTRWSCRRTISIRPRATSCWIRWPMRWAAAQLRKSYSTILPRAPRTIFRRRAIPHANGSRLRYERPAGFGKTWQRRHRTVHGRRSFGGT